jgi:hypothetical protein
MTGWQRLLAKLERALVEGLGLGEPALRLIEEGQVVEAQHNNGMARWQCLLA